jgi:hypothetical protein
MKRWLVIMMVVVASAATARLAAAGKDGPFSLEYCPSTPAPPSATGQTQGAVTAKFFPEVTEEFKLYLGTGVAYSLPPKKESYRDTGAGIKTGVAGQAGANYAINGHTSLNLDYKYLRLAQDAVPRSEEAQSPHLFGLSLQCNF